MVQRAVRRHDQANEEEVDDVENGETPDNLLGSSWDFPQGVGRLGSGQTSKLSASVGEGGRDENRAEALETVEECLPR